MLGLTVATLVGNAGRHLVRPGPRAGASPSPLVGVIGLLTVLLIWQFLPTDRVQEGASPMRELGAFRRRAGLVHARHRCGRLRRHVLGVHLHRLHGHRGRRHAARSMVRGHHGAVRGRDGASATCSAPGSPTGSSWPRSAASWSVSDRGDVRVCRSRREPGHAVGLRLPRRHAASPSARLSRPA